MKYNQTSKALDKIAEQTGYAVEKIYTVHVEAQQLLAVINLFEFLFVGTVTLTVGRYVHNKSKAQALKEMEDKQFKDELDEEDYFAIAALTLLCMLMALFASVLVSSVLTESALKLLAPEYTAMRQLMATAGGVT